MPNTSPEDIKVTTTKHIFTLNWLVETEAAPFGEEVEVGSEVEVEEEVFFVAVPVAVAVGYVVALAVALVEPKHQTSPQSTPAS